MKFEWISSDHELVEVLAEIQQEERYALDTEFHREKTYFPQLALIQLKWGKQIALVDPLEVTLSLFGDLFNSQTLCVVHAAQQEKFLLAVVQRIDKSAEWALPLSGADVSVHRNTICDFGAGADEQNLSKFAQIACNSGCHRHSINCKQHFVRAKTRAIAAGKDYRIQHESQTIAGDLDRVALKIADTS